MFTRKVTDIYGGLWEQNTSQNSKTHARIQNTSQNPKHFLEFKNTSQNPKHFLEFKKTSQNPTLPRIQKYFPESKTRPKIQNYFGILGRVLNSGNCFYVLGSVLDPGTCFGFWDEFWTLGCIFISVKCFRFWEVFVSMSHSRYGIYLWFLQWSVISLLPSVFDVPRPCPTCPILDVPKSQSPHTRVQMSQSPLVLSQFYTQLLISYIHGCNKV